METVINFIFLGYAVLTAISLVLYLPKLAQFAFSFRKTPQKTASEKRRISVVIPARGESSVIGDLLDSIQKQDYDRRYFSVNVIVQDETDPTVLLAKQAGANVFTVPAQKCKSDALDGYFQALTRRKWRAFDAYAIVDADAVLSPDYLTELNNALEYDCQIITTRKNIKNYLGGRNARSLVCNCSALNYPMIDEMGAHYRRRKNVPVNMCGQGLMIRSDVIEKLGGWKFRSLTEDYEIRTHSFIHGFTSLYYPYAVLYTEEVVKHRDAWNRRLRWLIGVSQCDKWYKKQIFQSLKRRKTNFYTWYDAFLSLAPLILYLVGAILSALCGIGLSVYLATVGNRLWLSALLYLTAIPLSVTYLLELFCVLWTMALYRDALAPLSVGEKISTALFAPLFMLEYLPIYIQAKCKLWLKKKHLWQQTERVSYSERPTRALRVLSRLRRPKEKENNKKVNE